MHTRPCRGFECRNANTKSYCIHPTRALQRNTCSHSPSHARGMQHPRERNARVRSHFGQMVSERQEEPTTGVTPADLAHVSSCQLAVGQCMRCSFAAGKASGKSWLCRLESSAGCSICYDAKVRRIKDGAETNQTFDIRMTCLKPSGCTWGFDF